MSVLRRKGQVTVEGVTTEATFLVANGRRSSRSNFLCVKRGGLAQLALIDGVTPVTYRVLFYLLSVWDSVKSPHFLSWVPPRIIAEGAYTTENSAYVCLRRLVKLGILEITTDEHGRKSIVFAGWLVY